MCYIRLAARLLPSATWAFILTQFLLIPFCFYSNSSHTRACTAGRPTETWGEIRNVLLCWWVRVCVCDSECKSLCVCVIVISTLGRVVWLSTLNLLLNSWMNLWDVRVCRSGMWCDVRSVLWGEEWSVRWGAGRGASSAELHGVLSHVLAEVDENSAEECRLEYRKVGVETNLFRWPTDLVSL